MRRTANEILKHFSKTVKSVQKCNDYLYSLDYWLRSYVRFMLPSQLCETRSLQMVGGHSRHAYIVVSLEEEKPAWIKRK